MPTKTVQSAPAMQPKQHSHATFILRIWSDAPNSWRGSLENIHTGDKRNFAMPEQMLSHLYKQCTTPNTA